MRRALGCLVLAAMSGCGSARTEVVVVVDTSGLSVPQDFDAVRIAVTDQAYTAFDQTVQICHADVTSNCYDLPLTTALVPGPQKAGDSVRVEVQALLAAAVVIDDAAVFTFREGQSSRLDFVLYPKCRMTDCAASDQVCADDGTCVKLDPQPLSGEPDLSTRRLGDDGGATTDGGTTDGMTDDAGADGSPVDLSPPPQCVGVGTGATPGDPCSGTTSQACYGGAAGTCGIGACRPGTQYCIDGAWGPCLGEVDPQPEVCDGRDQDCNGTADDGLGTVTCGLGECAVTVAACTNGSPTVCTPKPGNAETCDGKDNDCNGAIDEIVNAGNCNCVYVAPSGNDANAGTMASPLRTIAAGLAQAGQVGQPKQVCLASGASCPSSTTYTEAVTMVNGIHVYGGYESTNWTRNVGTCAVTINGSTSPGVSFTVNVTQPTIVDGVKIQGTPPVAITGSTGARVSNVSASGGSTPCIDVKDFNGTAATPVITRSQFLNGTSNVSSLNSRPVIYGNCSSSRDAKGHCTPQSACASGGPGSSSFYGTLAIKLDHSPGAIVAENDMCAYTGVLINGDAGGTLIRGNSITPYDNGNPYAISATACNNTSPWIFDNGVLGGNVDNYMGFQPPTSYGIVAGGGCHLRIDHNADINGIGVAGTGDATAIWCQRDGSSLLESRCQIVDNTITASKGAVGGTATAIRCDDQSCARIEGNQIKGGAGGVTTVGVTLGRSGTLLARNVIQPACNLATTTLSVGVDTTDSYARIENNLIQGPACGTQSYGVREHLTASADEVDLHSNTISGGGVAGGCTSRALSIDVGATSPTSARGLVRNNVLQPGACPTAYDVAELASMTSPRLLQNNDVVPGSGQVLYHSNVMGDLNTLTAVNALPGASANLSVDPMLAADGVHLQAGSMCIDQGTATGAPPDDIDGMSRPSGSGYDIGADEH